MKKCNIATIAGLLLVSMLLTGCTVTPAVNDNASTNAPEQPSTVSKTYSPYTVYLMDVFNDAASESFSSASAKMIALSEIR